MAAIVNLQIPFDSLVEAVRSLSLEDKRKLANILEDAIFEAEEDFENEPEVLAEVEEARKDYREGNYQTIQKYIAQRQSHFKPIIFSAMSARLPDKIQTLVYNCTNV